VQRPREHSAYYRHLAVYLQNCESTRSAILDTVWLTRKSSGAARPALTAPVHEETGSYRSAPSLIARRSAKGAAGKMRSLSPLLFLIPTLSNALLVVPTSPCAASCGNELSSTSGAEITCQDQEYPYSTYGAAFEACINCELSSTYYDPQTNQSDLQAALYNLRFALSWCLFGWDNNTAVQEIPCLLSFVASFHTRGWRY
jgi:hypothetical protein